MTDPAWVALSLSNRIGSKTLSALMRHFGHDPRAILAADTAALREVPGVGAKIAQSIQRIDLAKVEQALARWQQAGLIILTPPDADYPRLLRPLEDRPATLFVRGSWNSSLLTKTVALVGTRDPSDEARQITMRLAWDLVERGCTIVSGLAFGIDKAAHYSALAHPQGHTLAVLGSGVLNIYPAAHQALAEALMARGALLCEIHPHAMVNAPNLVARNRIISGLSDAVIVVETDVDGGAMHAARFARQQGRPVYALDLPASGNRALLAEGAQCLSSDLKELDV